jgi:ABC-type bacteriocin/lantibiotic exporter with double-glycine peptidase domain
MKRTIGYIIISLPIIIILGSVFWIDWKLALMTFGGIGLFAACILIGAKLINDDDSNGNINGD